MRTCISWSGRVQALAPKRRRCVPDGFTLIELLVVISIISILASMMLPSLSRAKEKARLVQCLNNLHQIGMGITMYADDHGGHYPLARIVRGTNNFAYATSFCLGGRDHDGSIPNFVLSANDRPLQPYLKNSEAFRCPVDKGQGCEGFS